MGGMREMVLELQLFRASSGLLLVVLSAYLAVAGISLVVIVTP